MRARLIIVLLALVLAGAATLGVGFYVARVKADLTEGQKLVSVFVAKDDVVAGKTLLEASATGAVALSKIPKQYVAKGSLTSLNGYSQRVFASNLTPGEQITRTKFKSENEAGLAAAVPEGMVAMAIAVDEVSGVGGMLRPGDRIDVIATIGTGAGEQTISKIVLQGIQLLATSDLGADQGSETQSSGFSKSKQSVAGKKTVTLSVYPIHAEKLAFAAEKGHVWLCLRHSGDDKLYRTNGQSADSILK